MGNDFQKLRIALTMANIDSAIIMSAPEEPENPVRAQNEADDAWAIREKDHDIAWKMGYSAGTLVYFKPQVPNDYQRFHFRWNKNGNPKCATATEYLAMVKSQFTDSS